MGATTIWERWDSMLPDGTINPGEMTSFNHYALGAIGDWLHRVVAGLAPAAPGYARLRIAAAPARGVRLRVGRAPHALRTAPRRLDARRRIGSVIEAVVPPNTTATVELLDGREHEVGSGTHEWEVVDAAPPAAADPQSASTPASRPSSTTPRPTARSLDVLEAAKPDAAHAFRTNTTVDAGAAISARRCSSGAGSASFAARGRPTAGRVDRAPLGRLRL